MSLVLLPAVDVADGQAVRLVQGEAGSETSYGDPLTAALAWQEAGAEKVVISIQQVAERPGKRIKLQRFPYIQILNVRAQLRERAGR